MDGSGGLGNGSKQVAFGMGCVRLTIQYFLSILINCQCFKSFFFKYIFDMYLKKSLCGRYIGLFFLNAGSSNCKNSGVEEAL